MRRLLLTLCMGVAATVVSAQQLNNQQLEQQFKQQFEKDRKLAESIAATRKLELRRIDKSGRLIEFSHFDALGKMEFKITDNVGAGRTTSTNKVWPGGSVGTSLTGVLSGNRLGEWDGGGVLIAHQEFGGRVTQVDVPSAVNFHATHVAGTMIGAGVVANAKGMAYQANLRAYDWNSDGSEMTAAAAAGMLISNHSYGTISGWYIDGSKYVWYGDPSVSNVEDYKFGYYDNTSASWDNIVYNNQYYLICKSAGNDRTDNLSGGTWEYFDGTPGSGTPPGPDGQYDCISTYSGAKNVLTIGAVNKIGNSNTNNGWTQVSDVVMSSFSGWGPMDDGRIKPDVVGCGVNVYSALEDSTKAYGAMSGTSMASPNVSGSLILVQQHYNNLKGKFMRASSLKGLAIHTADEAGTAGPDYKFGWGLVNIAKAVQHITDSNSNQVQERTLNNQATFTQSITSAGTTPLRITLCWTDPAGTPIAPALDAPNRMLVNDLDIRLVRTSDNTVFKPFILDKSNPTNAATTGDNIVDNVEQIYLATPQAGNYVLTVAHKGALAAPQNYSLLISGVLGMPSAVISANSRIVCTGNQVAFTDMSSGSPTSRTWYFPGGSPATSTAANVNVTYATAGNYAVGLVVTNALGKDSVYQTNYINVGGLTLPFTEDFESNSTTRSAWSVANPNADSTWRLATTGGTTPGNTSYTIPFFNMSPSGTRDGLITPALSFKGFNNPQLTFKHAYVRYPGVTTDSLIVYISTNCGTNWTRLIARGENGTNNNFHTAPDTIEEFIPTTAAQWCGGTYPNCITVNLSAYSDLTNVKLKFEGYNNYGNSMYLDNIQISGTVMPPVAKFGASKTTICAGEGINFSDSSTNTPTAWQWTFTGATPSTSTAQNPTNIVYNTAGTYAVKLKVTNASGSDSLTKTGYITVNAGPGKPHVSFSRPLTFCSGDSTVLTSDSTASAYQWMRDNAPVNGATAQQLTATTSGVYAVKTISVNGCGTLSDTLRVTANPLPQQPTLTSDNTTGFLCSGSTATLTSSANSGNQWYRNTVIVNGAINKTFGVTDSASYTVVVTAQGCTSLPSVAKQFTILTTPTNTSAIMGPDSGTVDLTGLFRVTGSAGSTFNWTITGGTKQIAGTPDSMLVKWTTAGTGVVKVQETGSSGCKGVQQTKNVIVKSNVGLNEAAQLLRNIRCYPNPASHLATLQFFSQRNASVSIRLINALGQEIKVMNVSALTGLNETPIQLDGLSKGIYLVEVKTGNEKSLVRLVVE